MSYAINVDTLHWKYLENLSWQSIPKKRPEFRVDSFTSWANDMRAICDFQANMESPPRRRSIENIWSRNLQPTNQKIQMHYIRVHCSNNTPQLVWIHGPFFFENCTHLLTIAKCTRQSISWSVDGGLNLQVCSATRNWLASATHHHFCDRWEQNGYDNINNNNNGNNTAIISPGPWLDVNQIVEIGDDQK